MAKREARDLETGGKRNMSLGSDFSEDEESIWTPTTEANVYIFVWEVSDNQFLFSSVVERVTSNDEVSRSNRLRGSLFGHFPMSFCILFG